MSQFVKTVPLTLKVRLAIALGKSLLKNGQWVKDTKTGAKGRLVIKQRFKAMAFPRVATIVRYKVRTPMMENTQIFKRAVNYTRVS